MKDLERDILRRTILEFVGKGCVHYTDLGKKVCASCHPFATINTFNSQLRYLLGNSYIERIDRGVYRITPRGTQYLHLLAE
jgi:DNA-binding PadR family transcriptional regulator